jgi:hypothetical protein
MNNSGVQVLCVGNDHEVTNLKITYHFEIKQISGHCHFDVGLIYNYIQSKTSHVKQNSMIYKNTVTCIPIVR